MKKILLLITIFISNSLTSQAQFLHILNLRYGAEFGVGFSTINEVVSSSATSQTSKAVAGKTGIRLGLIAEKALGDHFALQTGLSYVQKGATGASINYAELPLSIVYFKGEGHGFFVSIGPYIGYAIGGSGVTIGKEADPTSTNLGIKSTDYGAQFSFGTEFRSSWIIKGNVEFGIPDLNFKETTTKINNFSLMLTVGWLFGGESMYSL